MGHNYLTLTLPVTERISRGHASPMIKASSDRKTQEYPSQKNTFGTMPGLPEKGGTCPSATTGAGGCQHIYKGRKLPDCYVEKLINIRKNVKNVLEHNTEILNKASYEEKVALFMKEFLRFYQAEERRCKPSKLLYRIHWSGDVPDEDYAQALKTAIEAMPMIGFWGYTRSFFTVPILRGIKNLRWYVSADDDNFKAAEKCWLDNRRFGNIHIAYMGKTKAKLSDNTRLVPCPVDIGKKDLEQACPKCRLCVWGKPIWFKTK